MKTCCVREHTLRTPTMVATSSSQLINVNLIVRGTIWCKNISVYATRMHINWRPSLPGSSRMQSELTWYMLEESQQRIEERPAVLPIQFDTYLLGSPKSLTDQSHNGGVALLHI